MPETKVKTLLLLTTTHTDMASSSSVLSEEQFLCTVCLDVFTEPVTIQCGHNFCKSCITQYWDYKSVCECPMCKKTFDKIPDLSVNLFISELADQFKKSVKVKATNIPEPCPAMTVDVPCDICSGTKLKALKSCLVCLTSYCETHLEPHQRVAGLKKHKLIDPVENMEDRICEKHDKLLELFCRTDRTCLCVLCLKADHMTHDTVPLEEEYGQNMAKVREMEAKVHQMIQERQQKVFEVENSVELSRKDAKKEISASAEVFTSLVRAIERSQAELFEMIEEKQKAVERQAEEVIKDLEQEITDLRRGCADLKQLSHTEDHLHLIRRFSSLCPLPTTKDWSEISVPRDLCLQGTVRRAVSQLEKTVEREVDRLCDAELKRIRQYSVDVTLDPNTANPYLILSEDGKQVKDGDIEKDVPDNPERFDRCTIVLGSEGFSSGRVYYEVTVKGKSAWYLGVARESCDRKGDFTLSPEHGYWCVGLENGEYKSADSSLVSLILREKPEKVGVFLDYEEGLVSFYDVEDRSHIYSFTGCTFTEKLYPFFYPGLKDKNNSVPLIITPVNHTD
ncbi:hypothetical protein DPEC_G00318830 [Dallia pectoralis]|uniref:Uncharacterized protein n=1 Tax=Dallia pectoralis TaxID=75939 RepID=A0ACC2F9R0_DALPE|nr:hypothetical protein DPEC_G00318830 [Dallia pectoralis]